MEKYLRAFDFYERVTERYAENNSCSLKEARREFKDEISGVLQVACMDGDIDSEQFDVLLRRKVEWLMG